MSFARWMLLVTICMGWNTNARAQSGPALDAPPAAQKMLSDGAAYEQRKQFPAAVDSYRAALKAAGGKCVACLDAMARAQLKLGAYKESSATAAQMAAQAGDPKIKAVAEEREGLALFQLSLAEGVGEGGIGKDEKRAAASLKQAEPILKQAESDDPGAESIRMLHGRVLAALKRDEEASREFAACAAVPGTSAEECTRALHFAKEVSLARGIPAAAFRMETIDGKAVSLDTLAGKVVLIDFWATWCSVCARDSDYVQSTLDSFDSDKFVLLEVSVDESEAAWRHYVKDKRMGGVQVHDGDKSLADMFHVTGYPTYLVVDGDGMVRLRALGIEGDLKGEVRKLLAGSATTAPTDARKMLPKPGE